MVRTSNNTKSGHLSTPMPVATHQNIGGSRMDGDMCVGTLKRPSRILSGAPKQIAGKFRYSTKNTLSPHNSHKDR